jgi:hypothetical protein
MHLNFTITNKTHFLWSYSNSEQGKLLAFLAFFCAVSTYATPIQMEQITTCAIVMCINRLLICGACVHESDACMRHHDTRTT